METNTNQIKPYDFTPLLRKQAELDATIYANNNVTATRIDEERLLALVVELAELANATRVFKFWSKKGQESRERLLDEYSDGLHFFLSLFLRYNVSLPIVNIAAEQYSNPALTHLFLRINDFLAAFHQSLIPNDLIEAYLAFISLGSALTFSEEDVKAAYLQKLVVNYERQKNNY